MVGSTEQRPGTPHVQGMMKEEEMVSSKKSTGKQNNVEREDDWGGGGEPELLEQGQFGDMALHSESKREQYTKTAILPAPF